jgi:hypothetical protein
VFAVTEHGGLIVGTVEDEELATAYIDDRIAGPWSGSGFLWHCQ